MPPPKGKAGILDISTMFNPSALAGAVNQSRINPFGDEFQSKPVGTFLPPGTADAITSTADNKPKIGNKTKDKAAKLGEAVLGNVTLGGPGTSLTTESLSEAGGGNKKGGKGGKGGKSGFDLPKALEDIFSGNAPFDVKPGQENKKFARNLINQITQRQNLVSALGMVDFLGAFVPGGFGVKDQKKFLEFLSTENIDDDDDDSETVSGGNEDDAITKILGLIGGASATYEIVGDEFVRRNPSRDR